MALKSKIRLSELTFDQNGLIPAIIQDYKTKEVLMVAYMNKESLRRTLLSGKTCFWSRSRKEYWVKGMTSGHYQFVKSIYYDCDKDALLIKVRQVGVACHTGKRSCFYRRLA
ncbi:MAG: phosphoribosyl-AMP cyclohydrolase [Candidatus Omnitrophica bacterium]|nr:phosphoribosyl-AMP cyclohydrolase [Candidatus Omnitrophota bacterium]